MVEKRGNLADFRIALRKRRVLVLGVLWFIIVLIGLGMNRVGGEHQTLALEAGKRVSLGSFAIEANEKQWMGFYRPDGSLIRSEQLSQNHSVSYLGYHFFLSEVRRSENPSATILVKDESAGKQTRMMFALPSLSKTEMKPDGWFKVLEWNLDVPGLGPGVKMEYQAFGEKKSETFWIFERYPGFDAFHRKQSRFHFVLESLYPQTFLKVEMTRVPEFLWAALGVVGTFVSMSLFLA